jgi:hypothetical protein
MKVQVTVEIPEGYELACNEMRAPKKGELYLGSFSKPSESHLDFDETSARVILKKAWQPEAGKLYRFWHSGYKNIAQLRTFREMRGALYVSRGGHEWDSCEAIDPEELGK